LGAAHTTELSFVFDVTDHSDLRGPDALLGSVTPPTALAARVHAAWIAFATTGDPGWQPYDIREGATMRMTEEWDLTTGRQHGPDHASLIAAPASGNWP